MKHLAEKKLNIESNTGIPWIRPFLTSDKQELLEIFIHNTPSFFHPKELADYSDYLNHYPETYLVVEMDKRVIGGLGCHSNKENTNGSIAWILFHPEFSRKGLGKQAVEHCLEILKVHKNLKIVNVRTSQLAYKFFEKFGFELVGTTKDYWAEGMDLYEMTLEL